MSDIKPAPSKEITTTIEEVRAVLRSYRGRLPTIMDLIQRGNPRTRITLRWLRAFSDRKDREPHFSRVAELGGALGVEINIQTRKIAPLLPPRRSRRARS